MDTKERPAAGPEMNPAQASAAYKINMSLSRKGRNRLIWLGLLIGVVSGLTAVAYRLALQKLEALRSLLIAGLTDGWRIFLQFICITNEKCLQFLTRHFLYRTIGIAVDYLLFCHIFTSFILKRKRPS